MYIVISPFSFHRMCTRFRRVGDQIKCCWVNLCCWFLYCGWHFPIYSVQRPVSVALGTRLSSLCISRRIFENFTALWTFCVQQFFFSTNNYSPSSHSLKTKRAAIAFFSILSYPSSLLYDLSFFLFLFSFSFVRVILELIGPPKLAFSLKWLQISLDWFSKPRPAPHRYKRDNDSC